MTRDVPVLSAGPTPHTRLDEWSFTIHGAVDEPASWPWEEFIALPSETITVDIHCVTKWSKLDTTWKGVSVDMLLAHVNIEAEYLTAFSDGAYTTNLALEDVTGGKAWVAYEFGGEPLEPEHGGPARLLVPQLYFWKSAKWCVASPLPPMTSRGSGRPTATTTTATHGSSSATRATDLVAGPRGRPRRRDAPGCKSLLLGLLTGGGTPPDSTSTSG